MPINVPLVFTFGMQVGYTCSAIMHSSAQIQGKQKPAAHRAFVSYYHSGHLLPRIQETLHGAYFAFC